MRKKRTLNTFKNKFICGDCETILKTMPDASVDLVLTSPPYADKRDHGDVDGTIPPDEYVDWFIPKAKEISFDDLAPYVKVLYSDTDTPYIGEITGELN